MVEPVADLLAAAQAETGLDDYGVDTFREGLEILVLVGVPEAEIEIRELMELEDMPVATGG